MSRDDKLRTNITLNKDSEHFKIPLVYFKTV